MHNFVISPEARIDLLEIQDYIATDSKVAASLVIDSIFSACDELSKYPLMGHNRSDLTDRNVRSGAFILILLFTMRSANQFL